MLMLEKDRSRLNGAEFLRELYNKPKTSECKDALWAEYPLPEAWRKRAEGKIVVFFYTYPDLHHLKQMVSCEIAKQFIQNLSYLRNVFSNSSDAIFWWFDDGLWHEYLTRDSEAQEEYERAIKEFDADKTVVHDMTGNLVRALAWADAYYGDESSYKVELAQRGKIAILQSWDRQYIDIHHMLLLDWLESDVLPTSERTANKLMKYLNGTGSRKRLAFHMENDSFLLHGKYALKKLQRNLSLFSGWHDMHVCWCVDRNIDRTLACIPKALKDSYERIKKEFIESSGTIIENCSIADVLSCVDAYYGDMSAGVSEFSKAGKPTIIQAYDLRWCSCPASGSGLAMQFLSGAWVGDDFYFASWRSNGLFRVHKNSTEAELVAKCPEEICGSRRWTLFCAIAEFKRRLYLIPTNAKGIAVYDLDSGLWHMLSLDDQFYANNGIYFVNVFREDEKLWLMPHSYSAVVCINLRTEEMTYYSDWFSLVKNDVLNDDISHYTTGIKDGSKLYFGTRRGHHVIELNMDNNRTEVYDVPVESDIVNLDSDGSSLWLMMSDGSLVQWSKLHGVMWTLEEVMGEGKHPARVICHSDKVWLFELWRDRCISIDTGNKEIIEMEHYLPPDTRGGIGGGFFVKDESRIYIQPNLGEQWVQFDPILKKAEAKVIRYMPDDIESYIKTAFQPGLHYEGEFADDTEELMFLMCEDEKKDNSERCGGNIYRQIMKAQIESFA